MTTTNIASTTETKPPISSAGPYFYNEGEMAALLGIHRTTLRAMALAGKASVPPIQLTEHKRVYRSVDLHRLAGLEETRR